MSRMAETFRVNCPCCQAELQIDPEVREVLTFQEYERPRELSDIDAALDRFKGERQRREDAFAKSVAAEKNKKNVLDRKFDELLKQAKESPEDEPPPRPFGFD